MGNGLSDSTLSVGSPASSPHLVWTKLGCMWVSEKNWALCWGLGEYEGVSEGPDPAPDGR